LEKDRTFIADIVASRHDVLTCPASRYVGYVEVGQITQSHIEGAGHERGYRKSH
jgi:hypothetical protein